VSYPREDIVAPNFEAALELVLNDLKTSLENPTAKKAK
jgi:hypothetical protein